MLWADARTAGCDRRSTALFSRLSQRWRVPFLFGAVAAIVALYLRRSLQETASAETMHHKEAGSLSGLLHHKRALLIVLAFTIGGSLYFYTFTTYMQKFLVNSVKMDAKTVSSVMTAVLILFMLLQPVFGALSDRIGRRNNMILFSGCATLAAGAMFGGTAEYVALSLKSSGYETVFFWYVAAMAFVALMASLWMPDTRTRGYLEGDGRI